MKVAGKFRKTWVTRYFQSGSDWTFQKIRNVFSLFLLSFSIVPVHSIDDTITSTPTRSPFETLYIRADQVLQGATMFKPRESENAVIPPELRPLLLVENNPSETHTVSILEWGVRDHQSPEPVKSGPLTLYVSRSEIMLNGQQHVQHSYKWFYRVSNSREQKRTWMKQGLRITFGRDSSPEIWEVFQDSSGADLVFVSSRLEAAARKEFGTPLSGRRFSIENSLEISPATLVPRIISDGPIPMGPWIYLIGGSLDVSTILCRCMPSQVTGDVETAYYELEELPDGYTEFGRDTEGPDVPILQELWGRTKSADWIQHELRLPSDF